LEGINMQEMSLYLDQVSKELSLDTGKQGSCVPPPPLIHDSPFGINTLLFW
jgi:hypothetical protein